MTSIYQAITTRYMCPTNTKGSRYKASCEAGTITIPADDSLDRDGNHLAACAALKAKISKANAAKYGTEPKHDVWSRKTIAGSIDGGRTVAHVFVEG